MNEVCYGYLCFAAAGESQVPRIFGFAEFISALALLVITYTLVDVRYRFRLAIAPGRLYGLTFGVIGLIGFETLITEVWLAQGWWLPKTAYLTRTIWQGYFGLLFLVTFMSWVWYAYIHPPIYSRRNYRRYARELYGIIVKGDSSDLAVIADELRRSVKALVRFSPSVERGHASSENEPRAKKTALREVEVFAGDILQLIGNRKLCRQIIASSPATAILLFEEASAAEKYKLPMGAFARNITAEAVTNHDSLLYHEGDYFSAGLIGRIQPFSKAIYGHYCLVEGLGEGFGSPLDLDYQDYWEWTARQWKAYCGAVATCITAYLGQTSGTLHSFSIFRAFSTVAHAVADTQKLNKVTAEYYASDVFQRIEVTVDFVRDLVEQIDAMGEAPEPHNLRRRPEDHRKDIYDLMAGLMFELIDAVSFVRAPPESVWAIHHNAVWGKFFELSAQSRTWKTVQFKLRRLLYDEVASIGSHPNFQNARILGYCLNVMGVSFGTSRYGREYRALKLAVHGVTRRYYLKLREQMPRVADEVLIGSITYDAKSKRLVKTYLQGLRDEPPREYLQL